MAGVPSIAAPLRFELLGPLRALRDGAELDLGPAKQRAVLATLLIPAGRPVPTSQIVAAVWGDDPPENGANVVQKYVAGLRRILDPDRSPRTPGELLALTPAGYRLHVGAGALDVEAFEAGLARAAGERADGRLAEAAGTLRHALGLYRGEPLAGLTGPVFDSARERLVESQATAWEQWAEIELARGRHSVLVPDLVRLVAEFPLRERLRGAYMLALHRGGRQAEAMAAFREARRYLNEEFGVEPGERLQDLHRRILRADPSLLGPAAAADDTGPRPEATVPPGGQAVHRGPDAGPVLAGPDANRTEAADAAPGAGPAAPPPAAWSSPGGAIPAPRQPVSPAGPPAGGQLGAGQTGGGLGGGELVGSATARAPQIAAAGSFPGSGQDPAAIWPTVHYARPERARGRALQVVAAVGVPLFTCGFGSWAFLLYLAALRRDLKTALASVVYLAATIGALVATTQADPDKEGPADAVIVILLVLTCVGGAVHASVLSAGAFPAGADGEAERAHRREQARQLIYHQPGVARMLGIGRPDLPHWYDDGGLIDVNNVPAAVLAALPGVGAAAAHHLVQDRQQRGPFRTVDEVVGRGLLPAAVAHRLAARLICLDAPADRPGARL